MRKLVLALAAVAAFALAPLFATSGASAAQAGARVSDSDISSSHRRGHVKKVIIRRDGGWRRGHHRHGWKHRHHRGNKVVIKRVYR